MSTINDPNDFEEQVTTTDLGGGKRGLDVNCQVNKNNFTATTDPGVNDDINADYQVGSRWINLNKDREYVCVDSTAGAAVWKVSTGDVGASAVPTGTLTTKTNYSGPIPLRGTDEFDTDAMHDPAIDDSGTATGGSASTLQDTSKSWTTDEHAGSTVIITGGTGIGQFRKVSSNTSDTLTVDSNWTVNPSTDSTYEITPLATRITVPFDGLYKIKAAISHWGNGTGLRGVRIDVNGTYKTSRFVLPVSTVETTFARDKVIQLSAGDYVEMQGYQTSGGDLKLNAFGSRTFLQVILQ